MPPPLGSSCDANASMLKMTHRDFPSPSSVPYNTFTRLSNATTYTRGRHSKLVFSANVESDKAER